MLRVTTLHASSAAASAAYYTRYLTDAVGEAPGVWSGAQANTFGLHGTVTTEALQLLLEGRDPTTATRLGTPLVDRYRTDGTKIPAVAGFDATFSAPKSVSVLWALTGDDRILGVHDAAVAAALAHMERFGSTTRVRVNGARQHPDTAGLTIATFRQSTSRADDPQLHTHAVISAKVQTDDGRWWALDARYLKKHQRMLGGLYQSTLRAGLHQTLGVGWGPIVNGQAEIAGVPGELLGMFSKRTSQLEAVLDTKLDEFRERQARDPSRWERAALTREAAVDSRTHKTGLAVTDLADRWRDQASMLGWDADRLLAAIGDAARTVEPSAPLSIAEVVDAVSAVGSAWSRADLMRAICDATPARAMSPARWAQLLETAVDRVVDGCVDLDPADEHARRRGSDGRSVWIEPVANHYTTGAILTQEDEILTWAIDRQLDTPAPSTTVAVDGLDVLQVDAACAVAGWDRLVLIEGPAGTGKTTMLAAAVDDLTAAGRAVFGVAPTAQAARVLETETRLPADTIAKLLHEHARPDRAPLDRYQFPPGATLIVDESGMIGTPTLHQLARLAEQHEWRVVLVGDPRQLQAVGRGGLFGELCATGRVRQLQHVHRFRNQWEAAASLDLRHGRSAGLDAYEAHGRITPGSVTTHVEHLAHQWIAHRDARHAVAITATTNEHVDAINSAIQHHRQTIGHVAPDGNAIGGGETAGVGDLVVTRRNDRTLTTSTGDTVRNRDRWTVTQIDADGSLIVAAHGRAAGIIRLPADYVAAWVRLGYAGTEHANQGITVDVAYHLVTPTTTNRGLYVGATRGRDHNQLLVVTGTNDPADARDILERVITFDRADIPATTQRRHLDASGLQRSAPEPVATWTAEPIWLADWRDALVDRLNWLSDRQQQLAARRHDLERQLAALHPDLDRARAAWQPYQTRITEIEHRLTRELRPAAAHADHDLERARLGHRRTARQHVAETHDAVGTSEAQLDVLRRDARAAKDNLDALGQRVDALQKQVWAAQPPPWDHRLQHGVARLIDAIDVWADWNSGRTTTIEQLVSSHEALLDAAHDAPVLARRDSRARSDLWQLVEPLTAWLEDHGIHPIEHDLDNPDLGIDL